VLALPLYDIGVLQHVKPWIDFALAGAQHGTRCSTARRPS
jgi:hypothetical protein